MIMVQTIQLFIKETMALPEKSPYLSTLDLELMACSLLNIERSKHFDFNPLPLH